MKESKTGFQKFLWFTIALCVGILSVTTFGFAQGGFEDDFSSTTLDSAWEIWPGWNNSYGSYSITNGALRYMLSPWQHDAAYYDTPSQSGGYTYYPGLLLARKFSGDKWTFETKVNYNMPWSNGRGLSTAISIGNDGVRPSRGRSGEAFYILIYRNADQAGYGASANKLYMYAAAASNLLATVELPLSTTQETYYFKIIRDGYQFTLQYSTDGSNYAQAFSVTAPASIDGKVQKVVLGGNSWATPAGSYTAYDYIKVKGDKGIVCIDPGHGIIPGTNIHRGSGPSVYGDYEDDLGLTMGLGIKNDLQKDGYNILMTRSTVYDLKKASALKANLARCDKANNNKPRPAIYVSIHCNSAVQPARNGTQTLYCPEPSKRGIESFNLATYVQNRLKGILNTFPPGGSGVEPHPEFTVLKRTLMPAVIVETAFISNSELQSNQNRTDAERLYVYYLRQVIVDTVCDGVKDYLNPTP